MKNNFEYMNRKERRRFFRDMGKNKDSALYTRKLRVKVYARVSTVHESQINALQNQIKWYQARIASNWEFDPKRDMYIDEGITGTSAKKRDGFLQMIEDAESEDCDFDIIITREVCRFARNVEETFRYTRELKESGVGVLFISDDIWSFDDSTDGLIKLSIMASLAQSESKKVSERSLAGQEVTRKNGQPYGNGNILGYRRRPHEKNKEINPKTGRPYTTTFTYEIDEEQAATVRRIYELCLEGLGSKCIRDILMQEGHKTATGTLKWHATTINRILNNPTYMGYNAYGKSKVVDYLSHEVEREYELEKLDWVKGDWEPIISKEDWDLARAERTKRKVNIVNKDDSISKYGAISPKNMWIRKLQCQCGAGMRRYKWRCNKLTDEEIFGYSCYNQINNGSRQLREKKGLDLENSCAVQSVQECKLDLMAKRIFEIIWVDRREAMELAIEMIVDSHVEDVKDNSQELARLQKMIEDEENKKLNVAMSAVDGMFGQDASFVQKILIEYDKRIEGYNSRLRELEGYEAPVFDSDMFIQHLKEAFSEEIDPSKSVISYDVVDKFVNKIICRENSEFVWVLNFNKLKNLTPIERINHLSEEYKKTLTVDTNFEIFLEFEIPFEESQAYMKSRGRRIVRRGWDTLKVKVALDKN